MNIMIKIIPNFELFDHKLFLSLKWSKNTLNLNIAYDHISRIVIPIDTLKGHHQNILQETWLNIFKRLFFIIIFINQYNNTFMPSNHDE